MDDNSDPPEDENGVQRDLDDYFRDARPPPVEILEMEFIYEALAHPRRRYLCYSLLASSRWTLTELATKLVAWERDILEKDVADAHRDKMYVSVYHAHVPKLVELDIVEFEDGNEEIIVADTNAPQVLAVLECAGASLDASQESHARNEFKEDTNGQQQ